MNKLILTIAIICFYNINTMAQKHSINAGFSKELKQNAFSLKYIKKYNKREWGFGAAYLRGTESATSDTSTWVVKNNRFVSGGATLYLNGHNLIFANTLIQAYTRTFSSVAFQVNHNFFFSKNYDTHYEESLKGFYVGNTLSIMRTHDRFDLNLIGLDVTSSIYKPILTKAFYYRNFWAISASIDAGYRKYFGNNIFLQAQFSGLFYAAHTRKYSKEYPTKGFQLAAQLSVGYTITDY